MFTLQELAHITDGQLFAKSSSEQIHHIVTDSRSGIPSNSLFIALKGDRFNGHDFINDLQSTTQLAFLVDQKEFIDPSHSFLLVDDSLEAFQKIAKAHREKFSIPVIGITGSFGKTIIKEWLFQLLSPDFYIVKSPKSYNSQVGVPLSVFQMNQKHELGVFEAGISQTGEMEHLAEIIQPNIGVLTNIGGAHDAGFDSREQKLKEKIKLFKSCDVIVTEEHASIEIIRSTYPNKEIISWSKQEFETILPSHSDPYYKENIGHCVAVMKYLGVDEQEIRSRIKQLETLPMRLEVVNGKWNTVLLNDSYSNDLSGLEIVLDHARKTAPQKELVLCLGQFQESGLSNDELCQKIKSLLLGEKINFLLLFGSFYVKNKQFFDKIAKNIHFFDHSRSAIEEFDWSSLNEKLIVYKGARADQLERIVNHIKEKNHDTIWEINLSHLIENLNFFKSQLNEDVKLLVMVKATAYGTEANKIAQVLQNQRVDYLGVAYPEEGVALRNDGIHLPILVMNTSASQFSIAAASQLDIQIYSIEHLQSFIQFAKNQQLIHYPIHLKLETGMNRLGFDQEDMSALIKLLQEHQELLNVKGILSHLAVADDANEVDYTMQQVEQFQLMVNELLPYCNEQPILHLLNTSGILDSHIPQFDMVRLGIGLHGISMNEHVNRDIKQVASLVATISQIKEIKAGESVGYGRRFIAEHPTKIAIISVGYADGYDRRLGNGIGEVLVNKKRAKTVGSICMDMCMIDVTHIPEAQVGDEVILTSNDLPITELAKRMDTIPYELLTSISTRVQRKFVYE